jgi:molybdenum cofactor cytidylyltransferase
MDGEIAGIVLATGFSGRVGAFNPMLPLGSSTVIERAIASLQGGGVGDIVAVTGHRAEELRPRLARLGVREARNELPELGMFSSVLTGVAALRDAATAVFVLPVDIPIVKPSTIHQLADAYRESRPDVVYPIFRGKRGHPLLIARTCFAGPLSPTLPGGLSSVLSRQANRLYASVLDEAVLWGLDTPEEYARMAAWATREGVPTEAECEAILEHLAVASEYVGHSRAVAAVMVRLAVEINRRTERLDIPTAYAAGMLHDIARGHPAHDKEGERLLREIGYDRLGKIVGQHDDIVLDAAPEVRQEDLLYLADRLVSGQRPDSLAERQRRAVLRNQDNPDELAKLEVQFRNAYTIVERIERATGTPLTRLLGRGE